MTKRERLLPSLLACLGFAIVGLGSTGSAAQTRCICRAAGQSVPVGKCVCLARPGGVVERACCGMVLNNTSWQFTGNACPIAKTKPTIPMPTRAVAGEDFVVAPRSALVKNRTIVPH